ncbi:MAG: hypothetical protein QOJ50_1609, partial [Cryptosporangiaceae bacterium]|nr:hypothetical protein [Cryptosporangiaceae bacterium]
VDGDGLHALLDDALTACLARVLPEQNPLAGAATADSFPGPCERTRRWYP